MCARVSVGHCARDAHSLWLFAAIITVILYRIHLGRIIYLLTHPPNRWNMDALTSLTAINRCRVLSPLYPDAFLYDANLAIFIYSVVLFFH